MLLFPNPGWSSHVGTLNILHFAFCTISLSWRLDRVSRLNGMTGSLSDQIQRMDWLNIDRSESCTPTKVPKVNLRWMSNAAGPRIDHLAMKQTISGAKQNRVHAMRLLLVVVLRDGKVLHMKDFVNSQG